MLAGICVARRSSCEESQLIAQPSCTSSLVLFRLPLLLPSASGQPLPLHHHPPPPPHGRFSMLFLIVTSLSNRPQNFARCVFTRLTRNGLEFCVHD